MVYIFELRVVGDSDVKVNGEIFEADSFFFRSFNSKKMIEILDKFHIEPITDSSDHKRYAKVLRKAISDMIKFLTIIKNYPYGQEFGSNQYVKVNRFEIPTDEDFVG